MYNSCSSEKRSLLLVERQELLLNLTAKNELTQRIEKRSRASTSAERPHMLHANHGQRDSTAGNSFLLAYRTSVGPIGSENAQTRMWTVEAALRAGGVVARESSQQTFLARERI